LKIPVHNASPMPIYVHGQMIPAGETRHFDEEFVPPEYRPAPTPEPDPEAPTADPLVTLLEGKVAEIVPQLASLGTEDLERLGAMEQLGAARKGVLGPVAELLLDRAGGDSKPPSESGTGTTDTHFGGT